MGSVEIKNTICFAFGDGCSRPTWEEIANFIKTLDANAAEMEASYRMSDEKSVFIKFKSEDAMLYALRNNSDELDFNYVNGKVTRIRMSPAGGKIEYVKVYDLPPEIPDHALASVLGKYGQIKRVVREKFPAELGLQMHTGIRGVYMEVKMEIPPALNFLNIKGKIFYDGIKGKCFLCKLEGHRMNSCPNRKATRRNQQKKDNEDEGRKQDVQQSGSGTYAGVVADGGASSDNIGKETEEEIEVLAEDVVAMEVTSPEADKNRREEANEAQRQEPPVFKNRNDAYYFYKFGIVDYTEKQQKEWKEEEKQLALAKQQRIEREKAEAKNKLSPRSPPRKNKKNS